MTSNVTGIRVDSRSARVIFSLSCLLLLAAGLWQIGRVAAAQAQTGTVSFKTPEETITFYLEALAEGDAAGLLQACAVDEMSEQFRFDLYLDRLQVLTIQAPAPSDYPFYADLNHAQFTAQLMGQARNLAYGLLTTERELLEGRSVVSIDAERTKRFIDEVDPARLAGLQVVEIGIPRPDVASSPRNLENWDTIARIYGADELTERVVLLRLEGAYAYVGFTLLRYGESWKISNNVSTLGNTSALGVPVPTSEEEFQQMIGSN